MSLFGAGKGQQSKLPPILWQDKELRFDVKASEADLRPGEHIIYKFDKVYDTKGNEGITGEFRITNLRCLWVADGTGRTNISLGLGIITSIFGKNATVRNKGSMESLNILVKYNNQRFGFILTPQPEDSVKAEAIVTYALNEYGKSRPYRDLKLRGTFVENRALKPLPQETVYSTVDGVQNLGGPDPVNGTIVMTNIRIVWFLITDEKFNVSVPYVQIRSAKQIESPKYGQVLKVETSSESGEYKLGFKKEPVSALEVLVKDLSRFWQVYANDPVLGEATELTSEEVEQVVSEFRDKQITANGTANGGANDSASVLRDVDDDSTEPERDPDDMHSPRLERMHPSREGFSEHQ